MESGVTWSVFFGYPGRHALGVIVSAIQRTKRRIRPSCLAMLPAIVATT